MLCLPRTACSVKFSGKTDGRWGLRYMIMQINNVCQLLSSCLHFLFSRDDFNERFDNLKKLVQFHHCLGPLKSGDVGKPRPGVQPWPRHYILRFLRSIFIFFLPGIPPARLFRRFLLLKYSWINGAIIRKATTQNPHHGPPIAVNPNHSQKSKNPINIHSFMAVPLGALNLLKRLVGFATRNVRARSFDKPCNIFYALYQVDNDD